MHDEAGVNFEGKKSHRGKIWINVLTLCLITLSILNSLTSVLTSVLESLMSSSTFFSFHAVYRLEIPVPMPASK
jgi:hypothetical protein